MVQLERGLSGCGTEVDGMAVREMPDRIRQRASELEGRRRVIVLACRNRYFVGKDLKGLKSLAEKVELRLVRVPCSGLVSADWVIIALDSGADAVLVLGGHPTDCPFQLESEIGEGKVRERIGRQGFDPERLMTDWDAAGGPRFSEQVGRLISTIEELGPPIR